MPTTPLPVRLSPRPVRSLVRRIACSALARDIQASGGWPALLAALLLVTALLVGLLSGDFVVTWTGIHHLPSGTDAGLLPADAGR